MDAITNGRLTFVYEQLILLTNQETIVEGMFELHGQPST